MTSTGANAAPPPETHQKTKAGVPGRAHGLRKAGATMAAENRAAPHQLKAIFGWRTLSQAELYTEKVRQQVLAGGVMNLIAFVPGGKNRS
ncbi:hypothetical protein XI01_03415 [Bradyrhizobium sp. CCBAU 21360]|nr:hypothetical protein [Bradyrhizobium sp. CCBAU 21360]